MAAEVEVYNNVAEDVIRRDISRMTKGKSASIASTLDTPDQASRVKLAAAVTDAESVSDHLGKTLNVVHLVFQATEMVNDQTGEMQTVPRVIFLTDDGKAYYGFSGPLYRDATNLLGIVGDPNTWTAPVPVKITREGKAPRAYYTLSYV